MLSQRKMKHLKHLLNFQVLRDNYTTLNTIIAFSHKIVDFFFNLHLFNYSDWIWNGQIHLHNLNLLIQVQINHVLPPTEAAHHIFTVISLL